MPLQSGHSPNVIGKNIHEMVAAGHPARVAVAAALSNADRHPRHAPGGIVPQMPPMAMQGIAGTQPSPALAAQHMMEGQAMPPMARALARGGAAGSAAEGTTGFLHSMTPGRTDHLQIKAPSGSYVIPADIVSGVGQGNSNAGAPQLMRALMMGPGKAKPAQRAKGGTVEGEPTPILAAGGELIVPPELVRLWGFGDTKRGHQVFDKWVVAKRKEIADQMRKLPGPVRA